MIIIEIAAVEKVGSSEMGLARIRTQANDSFQRRIRRRTTGRRVIQAEEIQIIMCGG